MENKYFRDVKNVTMSELINWFQVEYTELADDMKNSDHHANSNEPNPYHLEGDIFCHTMMVCQRAEDDPITVKLTALLHDLGKPLARDVIPFGAPKPDYNGEARIIVNEPTSHSRKEKTIFRGHEGISAWMALAPLKQLEVIGVITNEDIEEIFQSISLHSSLFNRIKDSKEHKPEQIVNIFEDYEVYENFVKAVKNDSTGRFHVNENSRSDVGKLLGKTLYNEETFMDNVVTEFKGLEYQEQPTLTILCGLPCCGKDTYLRESRLDKDPTTVIISRDDTILEMGKVKGLTEYTEIFKSLSKEEHKEASEETMRRFYDARMRRKNIVINLTNMSKKSRTKYLHDTKKYKTEAIVFLTSLPELAFRNNQRSIDENKFIPEEVYTQMMKSFLVPTLLEVDNIKYM